MVALEVSAAVHAVAVELVRRLGHDGGAGGACTLAVRVDVVGDVDVDADGGVPVDGRRAAHPLVPLGADHDAAPSLEAHLVVALGRVAVGTVDGHRELEAERVGQPVESGLRVAVRECGHEGDVVHGVLLLRDCYRFREQYSSR